MRRPPVVSVERREGVRLNGNAQWAGSITWGGMQMAIKGMDGNGWEWMGMDGNRWDWMGIDGNDEPCG